jgi:ABC-type microcin C transport system permease subunit YejE
MAMVPYSPPQAGPGQIPQTYSLPQLVNPSVPTITQTHNADGMISSSFKNQNNVIYEEHKYDYDAINYNYVNTFIQPEDFCERRPLT